MVTREEVANDATLIRRRLAEALALRRAVGLDAGDAYRVVNGEGDSLPGVIVDLYGQFAVVQILTAGAERWRAWVVAALGEILGVRGVYERSAGGARREEGLENRVETAAGAEPPEHVEIVEHGARFLVDVRGGQKTGFFLDQRGNRRRLGSLARGQRVLNCFAYTGGFSVHCARGGASEVVSVESSGPALRLAQANWSLNALDESRAAWVNADVFDHLAALRAAGDPGFDVVILDPPPFARHRSDRDRAMRAYRDLNRRALHVLRPGGLLFTSSCSQHLPRDAFEHVVATAAPSGTRLQIVERPSFEPDHPVLAAHPEGEYLKSLLVRVSAA